CCVSHYVVSMQACIFFFSSRRRHTRFSRDWSSDVCSSDLGNPNPCGTFTWGEIEDYDVQLIMPPACSAAAPTNLTASNLTASTADRKSRRVGKECRYGWAPHS